MLASGALDALLGNLVGDLGSGIWKIGATASGAYMLFDLWRAMLRRRRRAGVAPDRRPGTPGRRLSWRTVPVDPGAGDGTLDVILQAAGEKKIAVIKRLRQNTDLGLKEAKDLVDQAPSLVLTGVSPDVAQAARLALEGVGATVTILDSASAGELT